MNKSVAKILSVAFALIVLPLVVFAGEKRIIRGKYIGSIMSETRNKYFYNNKHLFEGDGDTVYFNIKIPAVPGDTIKTYDFGMLGHHSSTGGFLKEGTDYTFIFEKLEKDDFEQIPFYSYYKINAHYDGSSYIEAFLDKAYFYEDGFPIVDVRPLADIDNKIYRMITVSPPLDRF